MDLENANPGNILGLYVLDEAGEPVECPDVLEWGRWLEEHWRLRQIAHDELPGGYRISTVFLPVEMEYTRALGLDIEPVHFETAVFKDDKHLAGQRYATRAAALAGHERVVAALRRPDHGQ